MNYYDYKTQVLTQGTLMGYALIIFLSIISIALPFYDLVSYFKLGVYVLLYNMIFFFLINGVFLLAMGDFLPYDEKAHKNDKAYKMVQEMASSAFIIYIFLLWILPKFIAFLADIDKDIGILAQISEFSLEYAKEHYIHLIFTNFNLSFLVILLGIVGLSAVNKQSYEKWKNLSFACFCVGMIVFVIGIARIMDKF